MRAGVDTPALGVSGGRFGDFALQQAPAWGDLRCRHLRSHPLQVLEGWGRKRKWAHEDSNLGPTGYEPAALTAELWARYWFRAGDGNRTRNNSLEGCGNTILQRPHSRGGRT